MNDETPTRKLDQPLDRSGGPEGGRGIGLPSVELPDEPRAAAGAASDKPKDAAQEPTENHGFSIRDSSLFRPVDPSPADAETQPAPSADEQPSDTDKPAEPEPTATVDSDVADQVQRPREPGSSRPVIIPANEPTVVAPVPGAHSLADEDLPQGTVDLTDTPVAPIAAPVQASVTPPNDSLFRRDVTEPIPGTVEVDQPVSQPNETIIMPVESVLDDHRAARAKALGEVDPGADVVAAPQQFLPPSIYKRWPSFTLFIFRLIVAAVLGIRATQELINFTDTQALWRGSILPAMDIIPMIQIVVEYLIAVMLLLGLASRAAGILLLLLNIGVLCFVVWGASNPFTSGVIGFSGEYQVLMAAIGLLFAGIGGGGAAVDGAIHRARLERKNAKIGQDQ